jgi:outer membrane immunogenic protein
LKIALRFMGRTAWASAGLILGLTGIVSAADLQVRPPTKAPSAGAVLYDWSGFYIGGHAGYRWVDADTKFPSVGPGGGFAPALGFRPNSFVGGGLVGYNVQVNGGWVVGLETDVSFGRRSRTLQFDPVELDQPVTVRSDWSASLRGRLGHAWDRWLWYVTGGVAWTRLSVQNLDFDNGVLDPTSSFTQAKTLVGWTVGTGIEHAFANNWTARIEYLFADYGSKTYFEGITTATFFPTVVDLQTHTVRAALSYKFGGRY